MEHIKDLLPPIETLAPQTKVVSATTALSEKVKTDWQFETLGDPQLIRMREAATTFCAAMKLGKEPRWLSLLGTSGAGKTHLAKRISAFFRQYMDGELIPGQDLERTRWRMRGGFVSWRKLCDEMRDGSYGRFRNICEDYFVVIDDIGAGHETTFVTSKLDELFDARQRKWTVVTANMGLAQIKEKMDARIASRMIRDRSVVVDVEVPDYNLRKRAA